MSSDYKKAVRNLEGVLADDSQLSADDLRKQLTDEGIDVDAFLARFGTVVRKGYQHQLKKMAESERTSARASARNLFGDLTTKTRDELKRTFESIRQGVFGDQLKAAALARCRNQVGDEVSDTELRSWLQDISAASGQ